ncbi:MAG: hypothetical protein R2836_04365 [Chitinophagales bacterium]
MVLIPQDLFTTAQGNFCIAGDTALTLDMKLIPMTCEKLIFAYCHSDNFTMGVDDAVIKQ